MVSVSSCPLTRAGAACSSVCVRGGAGLGLRGAAAAQAGAEAVTGALCRLQLQEWVGKAQKTSEMSSSTVSVGPAWSSCAGGEQLSNYSKKTRMSLGSSVWDEEGNYREGSDLCPTQTLYIPTQSLVRFPLLL